MAMVGAVALVGAQAAAELAHRHQDDARLARQNAKNIL